MSTQQSFETARQHHQAGRLAKAEALYRELLAAEPTHADALHLLGVLSGQMRKPDAAVDLIRKSIDARPDHAETHRNHGIALKSIGRIGDSVAAFRRAVELKPDYAEAWRNLGGALRQLHDSEGAIDALRHAIALRPDFFEAHDELGVALTQAGQMNEALAAGRSAVALRPTIPEAHNNLGNTLHEMGRFDDAIAVYRRALALRSDFAPAWNNLGTTLAAVGNVTDAIAAFRSALAGRPDYLDAFVNLGNTLEDAGRFDEALAAFEDALQRKPDCAAAFAGIADTLRKQGKIEDAIVACRRAVALAPQSEEWRHILAGLTGDRSAKTTPARFVRQLFDSYAARFDEHLTGRLGYHGPQQLLDAVRAVAPDRYFDILDLGCGTGLCGAAFRPIASSLAGVDLSPAMIGKAKQRGVYDRLAVADILHALRNEQPEAFDLVLAADLFTYVGDLGPVFPAVCRTLRRDALFAFTVEHYKEPATNTTKGFHLHAKLRFAHTVDYLRELGRSNGLRELRIEDITIRLSAGQPIAGLLVVFTPDSA